MWWVIAAAILSVGVLIVVVTLSLIAVLTITNPALLRYCDRCGRATLDFHATGGYPRCHHCRRQPPL